MSLSPKVLLSSIARERCLANLRELPTTFLNDMKLKQTAAVLVPLCVVNGEVCLLYTLRSSNLNTHSGQVSFPGGKADENEQTTDTALRESEEEIGVSPGNINVWGVMPPIQGRNKQIIITPVIGEIKNFDINQLKRNEHEVDEIFTVPMKSFCDVTTHAYFEYNSIALPVYLYGKYKIWGITGLITHMFLQCFLPGNVYDFDFMGKKYQFDDLLASKL